MVSEGVDKVCGVSVGAGKDSGWGPKLYSTATMWVEIRNGCEKFAERSSTSTQVGHSLYSEFLEKVAEGGNVKVKGSGTGPKTGMLGTAVSDSKNANFNCNGQSSTNRFSGSGICVFYGDNKREDNIEWLKQFKTGLDIIDKLNNKTASWKNTLHTLKSRAKAIYERVMESSQLEKEDTEEPTQAQRLLSVENATTNNTTRSHSDHGRLILPWTLLI
ncbi:unnamed protein product [Trypanosoma congolense IL3000]|uniref:WGS project CAEQ00000000 data, annotated contig 1635 n=1 Tax=Trypanosoma congolense (strain IL3000) TaxID=1068625 RepID=F9W7P2_TRYCI|nr:unnamed protein product [Trypanosoma congolense IL3000]